MTTSEQGIWREVSQIRVTCARSVAPFLGEEVQALGYSISKMADTSVETVGTLEDCMRLNLWLRTAHRVHWLVSEFFAKTPQDLYDALVSLPWERWVPADGYLTIHSAVHQEGIRDSRFVNQKSKDAVCDRLRKVVGQRPDSGPERKGVNLFLFWEQGRGAVYLDTTGDALSRRGYRLVGGEAPMQETLAAAILFAIGWKRGMDFVNPMCGSGTLAIEAALMAVNKAPGLFRDDFAFRHIRGYSEATWNKLRQEAEAKIAKGCPSRIVASDIDEQAVAMARENARRAGVEQLIEFYVCDFAETPLKAGQGVIVVNPWYGKRKGDVQSLIPVYRRLGDFFKRAGPAWKGYVFTGNRKLFNKVSLRPTREWVFYTGGTEARLLEFEIYAGKAPWSAANT